MAGRKSDFTLTKLDDLFTTQAQRDEEQLSKIRDIPLELIDDFPDHPFKVRDDEDMMQLVESVKERGVITPATVRQKEDGRYELVSGHRRKRACELAGFETLRSEIVDLNRDEATILMVESNFQRSEILPSEKAFAYKMRLEAMKRQAGRPSKENGVPVGHNSIVGKSREILASESQDSNTQIQRYVRLTNLVPELLEFVDEGRIKMRPAVELSYLDEDCQRDVVDEIDLNDATPSHDQTIRMRKLFNEGNLTTEAIHAVMSEEKPNQKEKIVLRGDRVRQLIPKNIPVSQTEDFVCKAYLYQLVEGKQKFASQIMTSKSPVRSAEDIDETALSYAEIKMLATGNPYIKEKMDLDIQVQKLKMLKSNFLSEKYGLEDKVIKFYPQQIAYLKSRVEGLTKDVETAKLHPKPIDEQPLGMMVSGVSYSEKAEAGQAIINACKSMNSPDAIPLGEYRGFQMELYFDTVQRNYVVKLKGETSRDVPLGDDAHGNIVRIDNGIERFEEALADTKNSLENTEKQFETAKQEIEKPFAKEDELRAKTARLDELNILLNMDKKENEIVGGEPDEGEAVGGRKEKSYER